MKVDHILTNGDASLATLAGSIVDARLGGTGDNTALGVANVVANNIDLDANGGSIGAAVTPDAVGNDLKIDSSHLVTGRLGAEADIGVFLTETVGALNVLLAQALTGNVRLTVRDTNALDENLNLIHPSDSVHAAQNDGQILVVENAPQTVPVGLINAPATGSLNTGWILLRVGDNVTTGASLVPNPSNTLITAGSWIEIFGDYHGTAPDPDPGVGTVMHFHGTITPGTLGGCATTTEPAARTCNQTWIFGNTDNDQFNFDQTYLGGKTTTYGSNTQTPCVPGLPGPSIPPELACGTDAPAGDGQDVFTVNQLQTMNVAAGHTLTLDGQDDTDTYTVNTGGTLLDLNYVINVLDTGAKDRGLDTLTVNGTDGTDVFLLRQVSWIPTEYAETPAMVTLLHGSDRRRLPPAQRHGRRASTTTRTSTSRVTVNGKERRRHLRGRRQQLDRRRSTAGPATTRS